MYLMMAFWFYCAKSLMIELLDASREVESMVDLEVLVSRSYSSGEGR